MKKLFFLIFILYSYSIFASQTVVGVSAFKNLSKNKDHEWLEIGIAESVSFKLRNVKQYVIVDRTNVDKLMNELALSQSGIVDEESAQKAGKALGADIIVVGNFQSYGKNIRINAKLVETESHKVLKQVMVTGQMDNIFSLQDEVALKIISNTNTNVTQNEINKIKKQYTDDLDAYKYYMLGQRYNLETLDYLKAIEMFKKSISIDKNYSLAYAGLAKAYALRNWHVKTYETKNDPSLMENSYVYAKKAIDLDPTLDEAYVSMARYYQEVDKAKVKDKWKKCREYVNKALKINKNNAEAYFVLSRLEANTDTLEEKHLKKAIQLNQMMVDAHNNLGVLYLDTKRPNEALESFKKAIEIDPEFKTAYMNIGVTYDRLGDSKKALDYYKIIVDKFPKYPKGLLNLAIGYRKVGDYDNAIKIANRLIKLKQKRDGAYGEIAYIYNQKKEYKTAVKYYKLSLKYNSRNKYSLMNIGYSYYQLKDYKNAEKYFKDCISYYPKTDYSINMLGLIEYYYYKNYSKAKEYFVRASKINPSSKQYKDNISYAERELRKESE